MWHEKWGLIKTSGWTNERTIWLAEKIKSLYLHGLHTTNGTFSSKFIGRLDSRHFVTKHSCRKSALHKSEISVAEWLKVVMCLATHALVSFRSLSHSYSRSCILFTNPLSLFLFLITSSCYIFHIKLLVNIFPYHKRTYILKYVILGQSKAWLMTQVDVYDKNNNIIRTEGILSPWQKKWNRQ